jgi:hypothetical protein
MQWTHSLKAPPVSTITEPTICEKLVSEFVFIDKFNLYRYFEELVDCIIEWEKIHRNAKTWRSCEFR